MVYTKLTVKAIALRPGDLFKMAGTEYRILDVEHNHFGELVVRFVPSDNASAPITHMIVAGGRTFKVRSLDMTR